MKVSDLEIGDVFTLDGYPSSVYVKLDDTNHFSVASFSHYANNDDVVNKVIGHIDPEVFGAVLLEALDSKIDEVLKR